MTDRNWSPFDPEWYQEAFDTFISTADELFNGQFIANQGYNIPDTDGSKSSVFRKDAVLNNSFDEGQLRETLKDIYFNSTHKLIASNHDEVGYYQWTGTMSDVQLIPNTDKAELRLDTASFVPQMLRDKFKRTNMYKRYIPITEMMNSWESFKFTVLLFINQNIYSDYEVWMDDQVTKIRFRYKKFWLDRDYPVYVYKFNTNYQFRLNISTEMMVNQHDWKVPMTLYDGWRTNMNSNRVIVYFNRDRYNDNTDVMGSNLEFLTINTDDNTIDLSGISEANRDIIMSEARNWVMMTIIVPKYLHEFPVPLATDVVYRPYYGVYSKVWTKYNGEYREVKTSDEEGNTKNVFVNINGDQDDWNDGWKNVIRPIVLSDAYEEQINPYVDIMRDVSNIKHLTEELLNSSAALRTALVSYNEESFLVACDNLVDAADTLADSYNNYLDNHHIPSNTDYLREMEKFHLTMNEVMDKKKNYKGFKVQFGQEGDFWSQVSSLTKYGTELYDRYRIAITLSNITDRTLWEEELEGVIRFKRPIEVSDFWTFEYDAEAKSWKPLPLTLQHHFPDVYTINDGEEVVPNKIYKALFFYSDTMSVTEPTTEIRRATPSWEDDMNAYMYDKGATYRDIFMEKFYWMGIRSIYKGMVKTNYRWEVLEYIQNNSSYDRFNRLFLQTMDPYFKMGLATYLKSANFEFPFDDAIAKMNESITDKFIGYQRVTNFEMYLNKTWIPSYFDYVTKVVSGWDYTTKLVRRPKSTFNIYRLLPLFRDMINDIHMSITAFSDEIEYAISDIKSDGYPLNVEILQRLDDLLNGIEGNIMDMISFAYNMDMEIYSLDDITAIENMIQSHLDTVDEISSLLVSIHDDTERNLVYDRKKTVLDIIGNSISKLRTDLSGVVDNLIDFDIEHFMYGVNNPEYFDDYDHMDDGCLIGSINQFNDKWGLNVQNARNALYESTIALWTQYSISTPFTSADINTIKETAVRVSNDLQTLSDALYETWGHNPNNYDLDIIAHLDFGTEEIEKLISGIMTYMGYKYTLGDTFNIIRTELDQMSDIGLTEKEEMILQDIENQLTLIQEEASYLDEDVAARSLTTLNDIDESMENWDDLLGNEKATYDILLNCTEMPNQFLDHINSYKPELEAIIKYIEYNKAEFIPYKSLPPYSDVYKVDEVEIVSGGLNHSVGDEVYIPSIGKFTITSIDEEISAATAIGGMDNIDASFVDTASEERIYDSITNGEGFGLIVKATHSQNFKIMNDSVVDTYEERIKNIIYLIEKNKDAINPYNNKAIYDIISKINKIHEDWDNLLSFYDGYMSQPTKNWMNNLIEADDALIPTLETLIKTREKVDLQSILKEIMEFITTTYRFFESVGSITPNYIYFDNRVRTAYQNLLDYYGNGTYWNDKDQLYIKLEDVVYELDLFNRQVLSKYSDQEALAPIYQNLGKLFTDIKFVEDSADAVGQIDFDTPISNIETIISEKPEFVNDIWYKIDVINVGAAGEGYAVGDIVEISYEDGCYIYLQVTNIREGGKVARVRPLIEYALTKNIYGSYNATSKFGEGHGLIINVVTSKVDENDSQLFLGNGSDPIQPDQFEDNDLFGFKFENVYDLPITYEVFIAGKQQGDFIFRHEKSDNIYHPSEYDVVYLRANDVMNLQNASIRNNREEYFVYKIDDIEITNKGAGYAKDQEIVLGTDEVALHLKVSKTTDDPTSGIEEVELVDNYTLFEGRNPAVENGRVIDDTMNNIDDEYNDGYYSQLTKEGIKKPISPELPIDEYYFIAKRYDNMEDGLRNKRYMYETVDMPEGDDVATDGDPDNHNYLGSRVDNSQVPYSNEHRWDGIDPAIHHMDPFIPDSHRVPPGKPVVGEYQDIMQSRIHNTDVPAFKAIDVNKIPGLMDGSIPAPERSYEDNDIRLDNIDTDSIFDGSELTPTPTVVVHGETIKALDVSKIRDLIYHRIEASGNPPLYMDECLVVRDATTKNIPDGKGLVTDPMETESISVPTYEEMPKHINEWENVKIGDTCVVESDETHSGHRMLYRVHTYVVTGYIVYDPPEVVDFLWNYFDVDWNNINFLPELPTLKAQYPEADWDAPSYKMIQRSIEDGKVEREVTPVTRLRTYISDLTIDDLSVYNFTTHEWEDLHDETKWRLDVRNTEGDWGFRLTYLEEGLYSYDMRLFLNKIPDTQMRNAAIKRNANISVTSYIHSEVINPTLNTNINVGNELRIRKLFAYEQKESYTISNNTTKEMKFKIAKYLHYRNELHLEDVKIFNKSANRFENLLDSNMFEVAFKDQKSVKMGAETNTEITQVIISDPGEGFSNGNCWAYNEELGIQVFGEIEASGNDGYLINFKVTHCPNPPTDDISLEFYVYQHAIQWNTKVGQVIITFQTHQQIVSGDGYIHNVGNRLAPLPQEFKVTCKYDLPEPFDYEIMISKNPQVYTFINDDWEIFPVYKLEGINVPFDRIYITTPNGRIPLVNPSTGKPSMSVKETEDGTEITYMNISNKYERVQVHVTPYPMRSVFVQRRVPSNGFIDVSGKINKPLNKKYFEFWMNGRLLNDEVTIITPTKIFLHGLKSLRNFEIIEINRDQNEFFSDAFLDTKNVDVDARRYPTWDFNTYLDDVLEGKLEGDNYTIEEQEMLLSPVWKQVERDNPNFKDYPPNVDIEQDVLVRVDESSDIAGLDEIPYQFAVVDIPTLEGVNLSGRSLKFQDFGFKPLTNTQLVNIINEIWADEIESGDIKSHTIISDDMWYGIASRMYDENGDEVFELNDSAYIVYDNNTLAINTSNRIGNLIKNKIAYDLS